LAQLEGIKRYTPDLITIVDSEGRYLMANQAVAVLLGREPEEIVGKTFAELLPPEKARIFRERLQIVLATEQPLQCEDEFSRAENSTVYTTTLFPLFDQHGVCYAVGGIAKDITGRVQAQQALRESEERFRAIFEVASVGIVQVDTRDGQFIHCNRKYCNIVGYTEDELRMMKFPDLTHPEDRERDWALFSAAVQGEIPIYQNEKRYLHKDGSVVWVRLNAGFIRDASGQPIRTVAVCEEITERIAAEAEREQLLIRIRDQARQLRDVMRTVPEGVLLLDKSMRITLANPMAEQYMTFLSDHRADDVITHLGNRALVDLLTSPPWGMWHEVREGTRTFEVIARPVANGPEPEKWVLVIQDVTEERSVRHRIELQDRLASVGQLAAGIAHDFNNLIAVIALYAQMGARDPNLPDEHYERLNIIFDQTQRAKDLVQQVLEFSRRVELERRPMELLVFLKEQVKLLERTISEDIEINLSYSRAAYLVSADPTRMQQVILNLAANARDAMPQGGRLVIGVEYAQVNEAKKAPVPGMKCGQWVCITVSDTGEGIPADALPHIFEPFFTTKAPGKGTGLGLAQVWGIMEQHEGFIDVVSKPGEGTTFTLYIPALPTQQTECLCGTTDDIYEGKGQVILVVEDNAVLRKALVQSLRSLNYRVLEAKNGFAALAILDQQADAVAVVVSDLVMPEMGGQALFHAMRERAFPIPVIMLSGHPMESELSCLQEQGLTGWMYKPPDMERLSRLLREALRDATS
jgi:PAS domain S-box-containing protein